MFMRLWVWLLHNCFEITDSSKKFSLLQHSLPFCINMKKSHVDKLYWLEISQEVITNKGAF